MPKRRASGEKAPKTPRPRKRQAVTKTNSSKVKALIRQNAINSPLLSLPSEVREKILLNLVGNNLIHVKHLSLPRIQHVEGPAHGEKSSDDSDHSSPAIHLTNAKAGRLRHAICVATVSEQGVYDERVSANTTEDESRDFIDSTCSTRHKGCIMTGYEPFKIPPEERSSLTMDLSVLGVSRQLYEECNHLLWATNTFSFDDATSLNKFLGSLNLAQKRNLSNIHISAHVDHFDISYYGVKDWTKALKLSYIKVMSGVQNLHLCLQQDYGEFLGYHPNMRSYESLKTNLDDHLKPFLRLRALNSKNITVLLDHEFDEVVYLDTPYVWTRFELNKCAEELCAQLAAPEGVELVKADAEKANATREITTMKNAKHNATVMKVRLESARFAVQLYTARAEEWDERVERYETEAAEIANSTKMSSRKDNLKMKIASGERWAVLCRQKAKVLESRPTHLENKTSEAVAKYKRAKARVQARRAKHGEDLGKDISTSSDGEPQLRTRLQQQRIEGEFDSDDPPSPPESTGREVADEVDGASEDKKARQSNDELGDGLDSFLAAEIDEDAKATDADDELDEDNYSYSW